MRVHFVVNPKARRVRYAELAQALETHFKGHDTCISPHLPTRLTGLDMVVAVGGDGTVNRVVNAVAGRGIPIGILPRGSANDLASALGIPSDFRRACEVIRETRLTQIDLAAVNGRYFATCGGLGLAATTARRANRWKAGRGWATKALGRRIYLLAALFELGRASYRVQARVLCKEHVRQAVWASVLVCNQPGVGGFRPAPLASNRDGLLDLCEISLPSEPGRMLWVSLQALRGRADACPEVARHRTKSVTVITADPQPFLGDGETLAHGREFRVVVHPRALSVAVPAGARALE